MFRNGLLVCLLSLSAFSPSLTAQTSSLSTLDGAVFHNTREELKAASASVTYDGKSPATILLDRSTYRFAADGTVQIERRMIYRVDTEAALQDWTEAALQDWSEASSQWDPWVNKPSEIRARVLRPDGTFAELDPKTITDAPVNTDEKDTYSSTHVRRAPLPGMTVGAIVERVTVLDQKRPFFTGGSAYIYGFGNNVPTAREQVVVELPAGSPFHEELTRDPRTSTLVREEASESGGRRIVYAHNTPMPAEVGDDVDLMTTTAPHDRVEFSTGESWKSIAEGYAKMAEPQIVLEDVRGALPAGLKTETTEQRKAAILAIVQKVHNEARYTGVEFGESQLTPYRPAEVLKRHYGDCKDKATLLVAMLRAAGIPAHLALLNSGTGLDVDAKTPGMSRFNHAIVYVPSEKLWIDATAEYSVPGSLPYEDQGRAALVIAPETAELTMTPAPSSADSTVDETRTYTLNEMGGATAVEVSRTTGHLDASYRSAYGGPDAKKIKTDLEGYAQGQYLAKGLDAVEHTEGRDLTKPFALTLTVHSARRALTTFVDAGATVFPRQPMNNLPKWMFEPVKPLAADASEEQKKERAQLVANRAATYRYRPFRATQTSRFVVPANFELRALPKDETVQIGKGVLTEKFTRDANGVTAVLSFDSGDGNLSAEQAIAMRDALVEFDKRDSVTLVWDDRGAKLAAAGKLKDAFAAHRAAIAAAPTKGLPHARYARALLNAGVGDLAIQEAKKGAELEPKSAQTLLTLGWVLQHDALGERFGAGWDRAGALAALEKAVPLATTPDEDPRFDLAILHEFDERGQRYQSDAETAGAVDIYRALIAEEKDRDAQKAAEYRNNLVYALFNSGRYKEVDDLLPSIAPGVGRNALAIASTVAQKDVAAGVTVADAQRATTQERSQALLNAGQLLSQMGMYGKASDTLAAGVSGSKGDVSQAARQIEMYRKMKRLPKRLAPAGNAADPFLQFVDMVMSGEANEKTLSPLLSHNAFASEREFDLNLAKNLESVGMLHQIAQTTGQSEAVLRDLIFGGAVSKVDGSEAEGYRVVMQTPGAEPTEAFVVKEDGRFQLVAEQKDQSEAGLYVLHALEKHDLKTAKALLDWKRELEHKGGGDDTFSGPMLPRFWTVGSTREGADSPEAMRMAAMALICSNRAVGKYLPEIVAARDAAKGQRRIDLNLLLLHAYVATQKPTEALPVLKSLQDEDPDSEVLMNLASAVYILANDSSTWKQMVEGRLTKKPSDAMLLRQESRMYTLAGNYVAARGSLKKIMDSGKATGNDYNSFAWLGLFDNSLSQEVTSSAQQATMMSKNASFADLHTLACVYAAQGKVAEAREALKQASRAGSIVRPNSAIWYGLGLLYEQYGLNDAAIHAYQQVKIADFAENIADDPASSHKLAMMRLKALGATP